MRPGPALALLAVVVIFAGLFFRLGYLPLSYPDEGRNAEVGREMKESGAWLVPTYNGVDYLDKPAFYFKVVALSLAAFGNNETAARLPSALFGLGLVVMTFAFCRRQYGTRVGLLAAIVVATTPLFVANARTVIFDIALAFFVCGAIFAGYLAEEAEGKTRRNWYLLGAAATGFGTLVKGPVGFALPLLVLLVFHRLEGRRGVWKRLLAPLNLVMFFAITLPWFIGLCLAHRDFLHYGLIEETFNRFASTKKFHRSEPFYFYLVIVAATFFPWSSLLPGAILATWKQRGTMHRADRLCLVWSVLIVVFFSISQSKLPGYILTVTVACGLLVARLFDAAFNNPGGRAARLVRQATLAFAALCLVLAAVVLLGTPKVAMLAEPLHISATDAQKLTACSTPLMATLAVFGALGVIARGSNNAGLCFLSLALFPPAFLAVNLGIPAVIFEARASRQMARQFPSLPPNTEMASLACYPNGLSFYLGRTMTVFTADGNELTSNYILFDLQKRTRNNAPWPRNLNDFRELTTWLTSRKAPAFLIVPQQNREQAGAILGIRGATVHELSPDYFGVLLPTPGGS
jgi:4-amino-4-deoxy-L-arabinose transferase-like glycosyltransferase